MQKKYLLPENPHTPHSYPMKLSNLPTSPVDPLTDPFSSTWDEYRATALRYRGTKRANFLSEISTPQLIFLTVNEDLFTPHAMLIKKQWTS